MFHSRRRAMSPPAHGSATSNTATVAAAQAFIRDRASNPSLSSAAAAAALRQHARSPPPVANVQTKRMVRKASLSSTGSLSGGHGSTLRRQVSLNSMTGRTFRSVSPNRSSSIVRKDDVPPLPTIPNSVATRARLQDKRSSSLEPLYRRSSPAHKYNLGHGRGSSLDLTRDVSLDSAGRSINFSYPISPQPTPPASPVPSKKILIMNSPLDSGTPAKEGKRNAPSRSAGDTSDENDSAQSAGAAQSQQKPARGNTKTLEGRQIESNSRLPARPSTPPLRYISEVPESQTISESEDMDSGDRKSVV